MQSTTRALAIAIVAVALLSAATLPALAAPASQTYQVTTDKKIDQAGQPLRVIATVKEGTPGCAYSVALTVTGPGGVSATDTLTLTTSAYSGGGHASASFPSAFSGTASTKTPGKYTVTATFTCNYISGSATSSFTVQTHGHESHDQFRHHVDFDLGRR
jgi:hypothetical protein